MSRVLVLGGYGNAGGQIVDLLLAFTDVVIDVGGRQGNRAEAFVDLHPPEVRGRLRPVVVDAGDVEAVAAAATGCELVILATGTPEVSHATAEAALHAHVDYLDLQVGGANLPGLLALAPRFQAARLCAVTQGGFHPGVPAAMVRHVAARVPDLHMAQVSSVIALDWSSLGPFADSTVAEMLLEFRNYSYTTFLPHPPAREN